MDEDDIPTINGAMRSTGGTFYELPSRRFQLDGTRDEATVAYLEEVERTYKLAKRSANQNPEVALRAAMAFRKHADELEFLAVQVARRYWWSWAAIGGILGMSRSAAQRRFASAIANRRERRRGP